eukprot:1417917-Amphidinium_carterae.2
MSLKAQSCRQHLRHLLSLEDKADHADWREDPGSKLGAKYENPTSYVACDETNCSQEGKVLLRTHKSTIVDKDPHWSIDFAVLEEVLADSGEGLLKASARSSVAANKNNPRKALEALRTVTSCDACRWARSSVGAEITSAEEMLLRVVNVEPVLTLRCSGMSWLTSILALMEQFIGCQERAE